MHCTNYGNVTQPEGKNSRHLNSYVVATNREKTWTVLGQEIGYNDGKSAIMVQALYGLKSAGASFKAELMQCMQELGYKSCDADLDMWMKPECRPEEKLGYYSYI